MSTKTEPISPARHLSAHIAIQSASVSLSSAVTHRYLRAVANADAGIVRRCEWARQVLASTIEGKDNVRR